MSCIWVANMGIPSQGLEHCVYTANMINPILEEPLQISVVTLLVGMAPLAPGDKSGPKVAQNVPTLLRSPLG